MPYAPIPDILEELRAGRMVVLVDDEKRENEGDLVCAAEHVRPDVVNFMVKTARGLLCVALDAEICDRLGLVPQSPVNTAERGTAFTVSVDAAARYGVTTGVSASDRATTIRMLADRQARPADFSRPGHVHPLRAREGGVLVRTGQTEGSVELAKLAGLQPASAIIEIMSEDGSMARLPQLETLCQEHGLKMCSVADVISYRLEQERLVERMEEAPVQTPYGEFRLIAYRSRVDLLPHVALVKGRVGRGEVPDPVLVRVQSHNLLGDVFGVGEPTGEVLREAMRKVAEAGEGAVVYLREEGKGTGLVQRLQTGQRPSDDPNPLPNQRRLGMRHIPDMDIGIGSQILRDLGIHRMRLLANQPHQYQGLEGFGLSIAEHVPARPAETADYSGSSSSARG